MAGEHNLHCSALMNAVAANGGVQNGAAHIRIEKLEVINA